MALDAHKHESQRATQPFLNHLQIALNALRVFQYPLHEVGPDILGSKRHFTCGASPAFSGVIQSCMNSTGSD